MKRVLCFGDSNTWGMEPITGKRYKEDIRWTGLVQSQLGNEYCIIEEGLCGRTTVFPDAIMPYRNGITYLAPCIMSHNPIDLIILMLGTNDLKQRLSLTAIDIARGMDMLIKETKKYSDGKILVISPPFIGEAIGSVDGGESMGEQAIEKSKQLPKYYAQFALDNQCDYLCISDYVQSSKEDCIHLTPEAHKKIAEVVGYKIQSILES